MYVVQHEFEDKYTGEVIKVGTVVEIKEGERKQNLLERQLIVKAKVLKLAQGAEMLKPETNTSELTVKEIKSLLTEKRITFEDKARKDELVKLLEGAE